MAQYLKKKKIPLPALLVLLLLLLGTAGCRGNDPGPAPDQTADPAEDVTSNGDAEEEGGTMREIILSENGKPVYALIRPENADEGSVKAAVEFRKTFEEKTGIALNFGTDWGKPGSAPDMETPEILFGITNRTDGETADSLGILDWRVEEEAGGKKIALLARTPAGLNAAADAFFSALTANEKGDFALSGLPLSGKAALAAGEVPDFPFGEIRGIYESSGSTVVIRAEKTTPADYEAYLSILAEAGFEVYDAHPIENNLYATLVNESTTVNVSHVGPTGTTRVVFEERGDLCPLEDEYEEIADTLLTGMKGETVVASEGMGYIIRLADGSFCIIDGGMGDPNHVDSNKLMNILRSQLPEEKKGEKPVIAAWLFTHLHGDHIGVFNCFSLDFHDQVVIERLVFNFPTEEDTAKSDSPYMLDDTIYRYTQFKKNLAEFYPDVPVLKVHTGNRFKVRNAEFEILYTLEDLYPKTILDGGMNECSILYKMTLGGQTTLWTGDFAFNAADLVLKEFDSALACDILQMAHHGMNGTVELYAKVNPTYALLPVWAGGYETMKTYAQNKWLIDSEKMEHMIVTGIGTWTIRLPYHPVPGTFDRTPTWKTKYPVYPDLLGE
ncbi:MAG: hypothetical protein II680_06400 [Clostridia bacterium]|nr:hypothetical protein [Clostridia bacterium]